MGESPVKKTYSTRKGALLLYSEEFADRYESYKPFATEDYTVHQTQPPAQLTTKAAAIAASVSKDEDLNKQVVPQEKTEEDLKTCGDLYRSILSFGKVHAQISFYDRR